MIHIYHRPRKTHEVIDHETQEDGSIKEITKTIEDEPTSKFSVSDSEESLHINFKTLFMEKSIEDSFDLAKKTYKGKVIYCGILQSSSTTYRVVIYPLMEMITATSLNEAKAVAKNETPIAKVCFEENGDINIFFYHRIDDVEGGENTVIDALENSTIVLKEHSEVFSKIYKKYALKGNMLSQIDPLNTLVYLEVQIDALSKLVKEVWEALGRASTSETQILDESLKYSVLNTKTLESCLEEINTHKANIRTLQQQYINQKQELSN